MSDILIRGMEMPTEGGAIGIYKISGNFYAARVGKDELFPIVELPEHGALIDRDAACERYKHDPKKPEICDGAQDLDWLVKCLNEAPVIVPASEEATNDPKP